MTFKLAVIHEADCIGCTKCIQACPFDAIIGAHHQVHSVFNADCTGCGLCVAPCPVDCISLIDVPDTQVLFDRDRIKMRKRAKKLREAQQANLFAPIPEHKEQIIDFINQLKIKNTTSHHKNPD